MKGCFHFDLSQKKKIRLCKEASTNDVLDKTGQIYPLKLLLFLAN